MPQRIRLVPAAIVAVALFLALSPGAWAQMYRWTDERGQAHYGQGLDSVPERYRGNARLLNLPAVPSTPSPGAGTGVPPVGSELARIPFSPGKAIWVQASINGGGSANLMLDTGASVTVISPRVLSQLGVSMREAQRSGIRGVTGTADTLSVTLDSLEVGQAKAAPIQVVSHDVGFEGDGLLGRDFLDRFQLTIDNRGGVVTLSPK